MFKKTPQQDIRLLQLNPLSLAVGIALSLLSSYHYAQAETQAANVQEAARQSVTFSINPQPLSSALLRFAEQAGLQVFLLTSNWKICRPSRFKDASRQSKGCAS